MATQVQFRRGTTSQNNAFTGAAGELTVDTDVWTLRIHDGTTPGGKQVPTLTAAQTFTNKTFGSNNTWNGNAIGLGYGGTGSALSAVPGAIAYSGNSGIQFSLAGTSGQVLTSGGTSGPTWVNASALSTGTATTATTAVNISGGSAGYLVYQQDTNTTAFIAPGQSGYILRSTGASTPPSWVTSALTIGTTALQVGDTAASFDGLNILNATGTSHWTLPAGTTAQRPGTPAVGMVRYNTTISSFEGYASGAWSSLGGVKSVDGYTYIQAETSAAAGNGDLDFYAENSVGNGATQVGQWNRTNLKDYTGTIVGTQTTQNVFNATATTVNAFGAATALILGATTGTATLRNAVVAITNAATIGSTLAVTGDTTLTADLAVNGGDLTTTASIFNLVNANATTLNIGGGASTISLGAGSGTTTVNNSLVVTGNLTVNGTTTTINSTTLTVDDLTVVVASGAADAAAANGAGLSVDGANASITYASSGDKWTFNKPIDVTGTAAISSNATVGGTLGVTGNTTLTADLAVNGGDLTTSASTFNLLNSTATTLNIGGAATTLSIGAATGTLTVNNAKTVFNSTNSVQLPVGTTAQRDGSPVTGMVRYNTSLSTFEGYAGSSWGSLGGVKSVDGYTYIQAETSAGASNGELDFYVENTAGNGSTKAGGWNKDRILTNTRVDRSNGTNTIASDSVIQATVATTSQTVIDSFAAATYRSAKYVVQITQGTNYQVSEIMVMHNGTTTTMTEYAVMATPSSIGTLATDVSGGNVRLLVTMGSATSATINITRTTIVV